jgi:pimeloyl-ACP methyl ester carboxylesterase
MKKTLTLLATVTSGLAIVLAVDPGRFAFDYVDVDGHQLRLLIAGHGGPAVVFEAGGFAAAGGPLESWERVQPAVSRFTSTVSYDRAGIGRSPPGPKPRDARQVARELHTALGNAHVPPPYVLVGHSFGGPLNRVFADMYPDEIAGMVLLDPTQEEFVDWNLARDPTKPKRQDEEWKEIQASLVEAHESHVPPGIPVVLITAMGPRVLPDFVTEKDRQELKTIRPVWLKLHQEWIDKISTGRHLITENSGHGIPFEEPELVVRTIREVVEKARSNHPGTAPAP